MVHSYTVGGVVIDSHHPEVPPGVYFMRVKATNMHFTTVAEGGRRPFDMVISFTVEGYSGVTTTNKNSCVAHAAGNCSRAAGSCYKYHFDVGHVVTALPGRNPIDLGPINPIILANEVMYPLWNWDAGQETMINEMQERKLVLLRAVASRNAKKAARDAEFEAYLIQEAANATQAAPKRVCLAGPVRAPVTMSQPLPIAAPVAPLMILPPVAAVILPPLVPVALPPVVVVKQEAKIADAAAEADKEEAADTDVATMVSDPTIPSANEGAEAAASPVGVAPTAIAIPTASADEAPAPADGSTPPAEGMTSSPPSSPLYTNPVSPQWAPPYLAWPVVRVGRNIRNQFDSPPPNMPPSPTLSSDPSEDDEHGQCDGQPAQAIDAAEDDEPREVRGELFAPPAEN
jgi:hypothetical protein